ncbi:MAG: radical SAM protein [Coriobacteriia bacterium]|nr:radical SAM protein [Coriobacteriia bacterium]
MGADVAFQPECLTLFLNNRCNLACRYCHSGASAVQEPVLSNEAVADAARIVAASCNERGLPMTLVLHGGGEPLLDSDDAARVLGIVRVQTESAGVPLTTYVATNGVLAEATMRWAAAEFDLLGLSCDGPPDVQDAQRPRRGGGATSTDVERSASILRECGARFHVRATVTAATLRRQQEVIDYAIDVLGPTEIRLEPVYENASGMSGLLAEDAPAFVEGFLDARRYGTERGTVVTTSMLRPDEPHGPYCNVLRHVVNLAPGDFATGCFVESRAQDAHERGVRVGGIGPSGRFVLDAERIRALSETCGLVPDECTGCPIAHSCSRGCPDVCALDTGAARHLRDTFRCRAQRLLAMEVVSV